jgi:hypothetical protein
MRKALRVVVPATAGVAIAAAFAVQASVGGDPPPPPGMQVPASSTAQSLSLVRHAASLTLTQSSRFAMTLVGATLFGNASSVTATGSFDFRDLRGVTSVAVAGGTPEKRAVYGAEAVYTRPAAATIASFPPGKSWIVAHLSDAAELGTNFPQFVGQVETLNPGLAVTELALGTTSAVATGNQTLDGLDTTRYDVAVDLRRALAAASAPAQQTYALAMQSGIADLAGPTTGIPSSPASSVVAMRVWATPAGRLVRVDFSPQAAGFGAITMTLSGYGTTVASDPPPADQVVDLTLVSPSGERENQNGGDSDGA